MMLLSSIFGVQFQNVFFFKILKTFLGFLFSARLQYLWRCNSLDVIFHLRWQKHDAERACGRRRTILQLRKVIYTESARRCGRVYVLDFFSARMSSNTLRTRQPQFSPPSRLLRCSTPTNRHLPTFSFGLAVRCSVASLLCFTTSIDILTLLKIPCRQQSAVNQPTSRTLIPAQDRRSQESASPARLDRYQNAIVGLVIASWFASFLAFCPLAESSIDYHHVSRRNRHSRWHR